MSPADRKLAIWIGAFAVVSLGIYFVARGPLSPKEHVEVPDESASAPLRGTDWNGPLALGSTTAAPALGTIAPEATASTSAAPPSSAVPPPLSAIPAPLVRLPLDEAVSEKQRARALEMLTDRLTILEREAAAQDARGDTEGAKATRVRADRTRARLTSLQDGGGTP